MEKFLYFVFAAALMAFPGWRAFRSRKNADVEITTQQGSAVFQLRVWRGTRQHPEVIREFKKEVQKRVPELCEKRG